MGFTSSRRSPRAQFCFDVSVRRMTLAETGPPARDATSPRRIVYIIHLMRLTCAPTRPAASGRESRELRRVGNRESRLRLSITFPHLCPEAAPRAPAVARRAATKPGDRSRAGELAESQCRVSRYSSISPGEMRTSCARIFSSRSYLQTRATSRRASTKFVRYRARSSLYPGIEPAFAFFPAAT